jgi:hypothetical protein
MKPEPPPLKIATPCPKRWEDLDGNATKRFCEHCQLHVHNLSAMRTQEREQFVAQSGGHLCIAYDLRSDGSMVTPSRWTWMLQPLRRVRWKVVTLFATTLSILFSGCTTRRVLGRKAPISKDCFPPHHDSEQPKQKYLQPRITMGVPFPQHDPKSSDR